MFKNCAPFTSCINQINNTQVDDAHDIDVVMPMYDLQNIAILIRKHQEIYGNTIEINQIQMIITLVLIFLLMTITTVFRTDLKKK